MAITVNSTSNGSVVDNATLTISHITVAGTNRHMLVAISGARTPAIVSTVTYGGVALTFRIRRIEGDRNWTELWELTSEPVVQTANVVITTDVADDDLIAGVIVYDGVDQTTPLDTAVGAIGTDNAPTINVTSEVDDLVFDSVSANAAGTLVVGAGQTQRHLIAGGNGRTDGGSSDEVGAATVTMSWSFTVAANWSIVAVNINQAAAGPTPIGRTFNVRHDVAQLVGRDFNLRHDLAQLIGRSFNVRHDISQFVNRTFNIRHDISILVERTFNIRHDISVFIGRTFNLRHDLAGVIGRTFTIRHDIAIFVNRTFNIRHDILILVSRTK